MTNRELKSKVMSLGNRLATKSQDRSVTFIQAWVICQESRPL